MSRDRPVRRWLLICLCLSVALGGAMLGFAGCADRIPPAPVVIEVSEDSPGGLVIGAIWRAYVEAPEQPSPEGSGDTAAPAPLLPWYVVDIDSSEVLVKLDARLPRAPLVVVSASGYSTELPGLTGFPRAFKGGDSGVAVITAEPRRGGRSRLTLACYADNGEKPAWLRSYDYGGPGEAFTVPASALLRPEPESNGTCTTLFGFLAPAGDSGAPLPTILRVSWLADSTARGTISYNPRREFQWGADWAGQRILLVMPDGDATDLVLLSATDLTEIASARLELSLTGPPVAAPAEGGAGWWVPGKDAACLLGPGLETVRVISGEGTRIAAVSEQGWAIVAGAKDYSLVSPAGESAWTGQGDLITADLTTGGEYGVAVVRSGDGQATLGLLRDGEGGIGRTGWAWMWNFPMTDYREQMMKAYEAFWAPFALVPGSTPAVMTDAERFAFVLRGGRDVSLEGDWRFGLQLGTDGGWETARVLGGRASWRVVLLEWPSRREIALVDPGTVLDYRPDLPQGWAWDRLCWGQGWLPAARAVLPAGTEIRAPFDGWLRGVNQERYRLVGTTWESHYIYGVQLDGRPGAGQLVVGAPYVLQTEADVEVLWDEGVPTQVRKGEVIGKVVREAEVWVEYDVIPSLIPPLLEAMFGPGE